ncbi:primosomal protein N' [Amnimonas aquatica]|nr:primosomal protein N' [Amnimonas aquatica]
MPARVPGLRKRVSAVVPSRRMTILRLALPSPLRQAFDYRLPAALAADGVPAAGVRVRVPFGRQQLVALVLEEAAEPAVAEAKLRPVQAVLDDAPVLPPALWRLALWTAHYYQHPLGDALSQMLPVLVRQGEPLRVEPAPVWRLTPRGLALADDGLQRAPRQQAAHAMLKAHPDGLADATLKGLGIGREALQALADKELAGRVAVAAGRAAGADAWPVPLLAEAALALNDEQQAAVAAVIGDLRGFHPWLLQGITGSGKTEVYLQAMAPVLAEGRQVLVLVPEIGLTPQTVARFQARYRCPVVVLHSGLTDRERLQAWRSAREGEAGIVIGTRSAVFTPLARPGLIIVDEEHDLSFKQQEGFRYHGRDVAVRRAQLEDIPVLLGSATPALESLANAAAGRYRLLTLARRAGGARSPGVRLIDVRGHRLVEGLAPAVHEAMKATLARGEQVLVFLNRRGYAPVLMCHDCGWQAGCQRCDARPTLHRDPPRLHCHHCGSEQRPPRQCPDCGSTDLRPVGAGTERLEDGLAPLFPGVAIHRVDRDSTRRKGSLQAMMARIHEGGAAILVGTQMLAKGHHFPAVTLVVIPDGDGGLFSADFRGPERLAQQLVQVSGRAGRAERPGQVLLQTHQPEHPLFAVLLGQGYSACARMLLEERALLGLPPSGHLALLRAEATRAELPLAFLQQAAMTVLQQGGGVQAWGPVPAPMARKAGMHRVHLLLKCDDRRRLHALLATLVPWLDTLPAARQVRWSVDVDPQELG